MQLLRQEYELIVYLKAFPLYRGTRQGFPLSSLPSCLLHDPLESALPESAAQVEVVRLFKCLGIVVTGDTRDYITLSLKPILQKFRFKCASWCKLPLSVTGRANLIKMVWAPQLLFVLHNAPVWIPGYWFGRIDY